MPPHLTLQEVARRWQKARQQGAAVSLEEICQDAPELIEPLRKHVGSLHTRVACTRTGNARGFRGQTPVTQLTPPRYASASVVLPCRPEMEIIPGYCLVELLGAGDHGEVWRARGPDGSLLALKVLPVPRPCLPAQIHDLERLKQIHHPALLPWVGVWQCEGHLLIGMDLAEGSLLDRLEECLTEQLAGIPFDELIKDMREAADGIDFLNEGRHRVTGTEYFCIQHLDIKPQNLLVVGGHVKLGDYGLSAYTHHTLTTNTGATTLGYAAPEVLGGKPGPRSDQYSLAATYCQLRSGQLPFSGRGARLIAGHLTQAPDLTILPRDEAAVLSRALAKNPDDRWPSCLAMVEALARCQGRSIAPAPVPDALRTLTEPATFVPQQKKPGLLGRWWKPGLWKHRWLWVVGGLLLLLIVEVLMVIWGVW